MGVEIDVTKAVFGIMNSLFTNALWLKNLFYLIP